ncbi:hypothetical protein ABKV19_004165 [Rosa sericea]
MRISVQGSGVYIKRERGCSIDPIHIDDPLFPTNNVGRNCFWIHQCFAPLGFLVMLLKLEKCLSIFIIFFCSQEVESWKVDFRSI